MNVNRLISEVHKRPILWDLKKTETLSRSRAPDLWKQVANELGVDVVECKRKWKNLRDAYRAEIRRSERRMEQDKLIGIFDPNKSYSSKWVYFEALHFISDSKRPRYTVEFDNSSNSYDEHYDHHSDSFGGDIKMEPQHTETADNNNETNNQSLQHSFGAGNSNGAGNDGDDEAANDILFEEFQHIATPEAARRLSATLSMTNSLEHNLSNDTSEKPASETTQNNCKCSNREDRVHFLEDLEKEEQKLMQSTDQDIKRALDHVGDSDYNFLVSFLPQMKKMNDLQNLQFRARMCDLILNIMAPTMSSHNSPIPPPLTPAPCLGQLESREMPALKFPTQAETQLSSRQSCENRLVCADQ